MKITASVTKCSNQDSGLCYLYLPIFLKENKNVVITAFLRKLRDYSSVRIGFNMINKCHTLPTVYLMLRSIKS